MNSSNLPIYRKGNRLSLRREEDSPMLAIQNEMNRLFDQFFTDPFQLLSGRYYRPTEFYPRVDVSETDTEYKVSAELPGMEDKDVQISLEKSALILSGEKKSEAEEKDKNYHRIERSYGSFQRVIQFDRELNEDKASAVFKNGVLTITLPKAEEAIKKSRKIEIKKE